MSDRTREKLIKVVLYILMMAAIVLIVFLLMRPVVRSLLSGFKGSDNWEYKLLPGEYEIVRVDSEAIELVSTEEGEKQNDGAVVVDAYISAFWHDDRFIVVKQYPGRKDGNYDRYYYCIDTQTEEIFGPLDDDAYASLRVKLGIRIEKWILTVPKPEGAE